MKTFFTFTMLIFSSFALAESVNFQVPAFKGELKIVPSDVKITSITTEGRTQFCNFWGTTCAGGPREEESVNVDFKLDPSTNLIKISSKGMKIKTTKFSNRFSSCNLSLRLTGVKSDGTKMYGSVRLIWENDKDKCNSLSSIRDEINNQLKVPAEVKLSTYHW